MTTPGLPQSVSDHRGDQPRADTQVLWHSWQNRQSSALLGHCQQLCRPINTKVDTLPRAGGVHFVWHRISELHVHFSQYLVRQLLTREKNTPIMPAKSPKSLRFRSILDTIRHIGPAYFARPDGWVPTLMGSEAGGGSGLPLRLMTKHGCQGRQELRLFRGSRTPPRSVNSKRLSL
jgi:hypothetical protein